MKVENIKELEKLMRLCRKQGVDIIKIDNIEFHLTPQVAEAKPKKQASALNLGVDLVEQAAITVNETIETEELTDEQKLFYSSTDHAELGLDS